MSLIHETEDYEYHSLSEWQRQGGNMLTVDFMKDCGFAPGPIGPIQYVRVKKKEKENQQ